MVVIESSKLFCGLSPQELQALRQCVQERDYPANHQIFKEGDEGDGLYVVGEGAVQIATLFGDGQRRVLNRVGNGDFFGEMAVIDSAPRSASAVTERATKLYFLPLADATNLFQTFPAMAMRLTREFSLRMREFNRHYVQEVLQSERLALVGRFARSIVHDFKNPLNIIGLASDIGAMEKATPQMRQTAALRIRKQVDRLTNMINELLEFTRGSQNAVNLAPVDYAGFIAQLIEDIAPEADEKSVSIVRENDPPGVAVLMDPQRLSHVFHNLIHNAVDAMPGGGMVILRFSVADGKLLTELEDTGKGFAPEIVDRLFEAFATFGKPQGTGLGLSICKRIIEDHQGWIEARRVEGRGAIFRFALRIAP